MKRYTDYTPEELVALSDEAIDTLIDLECAIAGAPLVPPVPAPPDKAKPEPDLNLSVVNLHFLEREDAVKTAEFARGLSLCDTKWTYSNGPSHTEVDYVKKTPEISTTACWDPGTWARQREAIEEADLLATAYTKLKKEYDAAATMRSEATGPVMEAVREARRRTAKANLLAAAFERYLVLADGSEEVALKFLGDAYYDAADFGYEVPAVPDKDEDN
jgi:hypothetical protein